MIICSNCKNPNPSYEIIRHPDCLEARCKHCSVGYDIGWKTEGYVKDGNEQRTFRI